MNGLKNFCLERCAGYGLDITTVEQPTHQEFHLTFRLLCGEKPAKMIHRLALALRERDASVVWHEVFGSLTAHAETMSALSQQFGRLNVIRIDGKLGLVIRVSECSAVVLVNRRVREFTTRFDKRVRIRPSPVMFRISANSEAEILNRKARKKRKQRNGKETMKTYEGSRQGYAVIVTVNGRPLNPRLDLYNHSPTGFEWGYCGSGPAQLALAISGRPPGR